MQDQKEIQITPKQEQVYKFICRYHTQTNGRVPKLKEITEHMGFSHTTSASSYIKKLVEKRLLRRFESSRGYWLPEDPPTYLVGNYYVPDIKQECVVKHQGTDRQPSPAPPPVTRPEDEFQYIRLGIGEAATIGDVYIGLVHVETDKEVAALEVIAPASMGVLRRDVYSDDEQPQQPGPNEILLRCLEKTTELMTTEIVRFKEAGIQSAGKE